MKWHVILGHALLAAGRHPNAKQGLLAALVAAATTLVALEAGVKPSDLLSSNPVSAPIQSKP